MKNILSNVSAFVWFVAILIWGVLLLPICVIMMPTNIRTIWETGFATVTVGYAFLILFGLVFGFTMIVPVFRRCLKKLPWLYPYIVILMADALILTVAEEILNYGYQVKSDARHTIFSVIMVIQIIVCRVVMCLYFKKKPVKIARDEDEE